MSLKILADPWHWRSGIIVVFWTSAFFLAFYGFHAYPIYQFFNFVRVSLTAAYIFASDLLITLLRLFITNTLLNPFQRAISLLPLFLSSVMLAPAASKDHSTDHDSSHVPRAGHACCNAVMLGACELGNMILIAWLTDRWYLCVDFCAHVLHTGTWVTIFWMEIFFMFVLIFPSAFGMVSTLRNFRSLWARTFRCLGEWPFLLLLLAFIEIYWWHRNCSGNLTRGGLSAFWSERWTSTRWFWTLLLSFARNPCFH